MTQTLELNSQQLSIHYKYYYNVELQHNDSIEIRVFIASCLRTNCFIMQDSARHICNTNYEPIIMD